MKQPHIQLDESLNVRYAILPGDPRRAERIASHMSEVEDLGMNREYRSLVGTYRGARILAMSTGMGGVSTGIAVEELHNIGVTHAIRIGSCGALQTDIAPGELLIAAGAVRDDGTSRAYVRETGADPPVLHELIERADHIRHAVPLAAARADGEHPRAGLRPPPRHHPQPRELLHRRHRGDQRILVEKGRARQRHGDRRAADRRAAARHEMRERAQQRRALEGVHFPRRRLLRRRRRRGRRGRGAQHSRRAGDLRAAGSREKIGKTGTFSSFQRQTLQRP